MYPVGSGFNSNCPQITPFVADSSIQTNLYLECPPAFTKSLWDKISTSTKKHLTENDFVIPIGLSGNYRYYNVENCRIVIDFDSIVGHGRLKDLRFGQNLETKEFLAFKCISCSDHNPEVVGLRKLNRLRGLIFDKDEVWMAMELVNGVSLTEYDWKKHVNNVDSAIKLAISYLDELKFVANSGVNQSDRNPGNVMVDLKKQKVFLVDFGGHGTFNYTTSEFLPDNLSSYICIHDLNYVMTLLPRPYNLEKNALTGKYENFYSFLEETRLSERNDKNFFYFNFTIEDLRKKLSDFLN